MEISVEVDRDIIFLKLTGSLVANSIEQLKSQIQKLVEKKFLNIILDMSKVDFVDSSGLGLCITTARDLAAQSGKLICYGLRDNVQKLFSMTKADQKISVLPSRTAALDCMLTKILAEA